VKFEHLTSSKKYFEKNTTIQFYAAKECAIYNGDPQSSAIPYIFKNVTNRKQ